MNDCIKYKGCAVPLTGQLCPEKCNMKVTEKYPEGFFMEYADPSNPGTIKRYDVTGVHGRGGIYSAKAIETPEGDYVRYKDIKHILENYTNILVALIDTNSELEFYAHERPGCKCERCTRCNLNMELLKGLKK